MNFESILLMRQELILIAITLLLLLSDLLSSDNNKLFIRPIALILFFGYMIVGFLPINTGTLFGGMYVSTAVTVMVKNILNVGVFLILLQSNKWLSTEENKNKIAEFYVILFSSLIGMFFMISSGNFLMFYLGLETATIPIATLAAYELHKQKSAEAGIKLLFISALSSGVMLFGISMLYATTGSVYFNLVSAGITGTPLQILAFIFFASGMFFKISAVPFHLWTADVYEGAPIPVTTYLSVISKGAAIFIFLITLYKVFSPIIVQWQEIIWVIALITMVVGNLFAIRQKNLKRFLAFSSISQAGFLLLGLIGGNEMGMSAVVYYILVYIFSNVGAFTVVSAVYNATGKENIDDYNGLYLTNPKLSLVMLISLFSLAGIPPVAGFFGKFFLFAAAAEKGFYILVFLALINTIISLYYYLLVVKATLINKSESPIAFFKSDWATRLCLVLCMLGLFAIGFASPIFEYLRTIATGV